MAEIRLLPKSKFKSEADIQPKGKQLRGWTTFELEFISEPFKLMQDTADRLSKAEGVLDKGRFSGSR
jgi:hypothetical protein